MNRTFTVFFIRKSDQRLLRRFTTNQMSKYFVKKTIEEQFKKVLDLYTDLEKKDIVVKEYEGVVYDW